MAGGRPEIFTQAIADEICLEIATSSKSLRTICKAEHLPCVATVLNWLRTNKEFLAQYTQAKEEQADFLVEEMIEIADDGSNDTIHTDKGDFENKEWTSRSKLRVETRKWAASKLKAKKYGDKVTNTHEGGEKPIETTATVTIMPYGTQMPPLPTNENDVDTQRR